MNKGLFKVVAVSGLLAVMGSAQAEDDGLGIGVGARYSTLGTGVELGKSLGDNFGVRLGLNSYSMSADQTIDGVDVNASLDLSSTALMLDWYPLSGSFHITAGYISSANELSGNAVFQEGDVVGGYTIPAGQNAQVDASVKLGSGPYLGLGWGNVPASGFGVIIEAGVMQMSPSASLNQTGGTVVLSAADISQEESNWQNDMDQFDTYPVVAVGISYGF